MRLTLPPRGRRVQQVLAIGAAPALVAGLAFVATSNPATAAHDSSEPSAADRSPRVWSSDAGSADAASGAERLRAYWTPKRMANAVPADRIAARVARTQGRTTESASAQRMKPTAAAQPALPTAPAGAKVLKSKTIGKVFFRSGGKDMVCSGAAVNSKRKNMVMTAGHCVHGGPGRGWHKKWIFVPGYGPGHRAPNGIYPKTRLVALKGWIKRGNFNDDAAIALVRPGKGTRKKLVKKVGGFGAQFGRSRHRRLAAVGYSELGYRGDKQKSCRKRTHRLRKTGQIEMRCRVLTPGSSGGPWVKGKVRKGRGYINGVNSNVNRRRHPTKMRSPYFGRDVFRMYKAFRNKR